MTREIWLFGNDACCDLEDCEILYESVTDICDLCIQRSFYDLEVANPGSWPRSPHTPLLTDDELKDMVRGASNAATLTRQYNDSVADERQSASPDDEEEASLEEEVLVDEESLVDEEIPVDKETPVNKETSTDEEILVGEELLLLSRLRSNLDSEQRIH